MKEIKRNDIYYAELDPVVGSEQGGLRPVLILQNDTGNRHSPTTIVAAITSSPRKTKLPTHITVQTKGLTKESIVLLEQIRTIEKAVSRNMSAVWTSRRWNRSTEPLPSVSGSNIWRH